MAAADRGGTVTDDRAIALLESIDLNDAEQAHIEADRLLLQFLETNGHLEVANAYRRVREQAGFRY